MSPKNNTASPRPIPSFLEGKQSMKSSLMGEDFVKSMPSSMIQSPKRPPRMSEHFLHPDIKSSTT